MRMKLWKKVILTLLAIVLLLIVGLVAIFFFWLGPTAETLVESIGSKALGTRVDIQSLSINPRRGTLELHGFQIGTYEGFGRTNTWELAQLHVDIDVRSLFSDTIVIHSIEINSPHFTYEQNEATDNISEFIRNIQTFAKIDPNQPKEEKPKKEEDPNKTPKKVILEALIVNDMQVHLANTARPELDIQLTAEQLTLSLTNGLIQLDHLVLSDPSLIATPNVAEIESVTIQLDSESIYSGSLVIEEVQISKPYAYFEQNTETDTLAAFMQIVDTFTPSPTVPAAEEAPEPPQTEAEENAPTPVVFHNLAIDDIRLHLINTANPKLNILLKLENLAVNAPQGTVGLSGLTIGNPSQLATPNLFELESIQIKIDPASLLTGTVIIEDVQVTNPYAFLEQNPETDTVAEFIKISDRFAARVGVAPRTGAPLAAPHAALPVAPSVAPFELRNLEVDDIQLNLLDSTGTNSPAAPRTIAAIGRISVKLTDGQLQIENIAIPNPPGFADTHFFYLKNIQVTIDPDSIFSKQIAIQKIMVDSPKIHIEQTETTGNFAELIASLKGFKPDPKEPQASGQPTPIPDSKTPKEAAPPTALPVVLDTLLVTNFTVHIVVPTPTNMTSRLFGKMNLRDKLNPMSHDEDEEAPIEKTSIDLLAFDLLNIEPLKGLLEISNLEIGNPEGFANKNLIQAELYRMDFTPSTLQSNIFIIEDILIEKPRIAYERKITTDNIEALQELITSIFQRREAITGNPILEEPELAGPPAQGETQVEAAEAAEAAGKKVIIEHLELSDGIVRAKISKLPTIPVIPLSLEINDLGKEEGGTSIQDAFGIFFSTFYDAIIGVVGNATGLAGDTLKGAGNFTLDGLGTLTGGLIGTDKEDEAKEQE